MTATSQSANGVEVYRGFMDLSALVVDEDLARAIRPGGVDETHAQALANKLARGDGQETLAEDQLYHLTPINVVTLFGSDDPIVAHGFHRRRAYELAGRAMIPVVVTEGDADHLLKVAATGNGEIIKAWSTAERRLFCRNLMGQEKYRRKPWGWYEEMTGLWTAAVRDEWLNAYGAGPREVEGEDGVIYTFDVQPPKKKAALAPVQEDEVAGLSGGATPIALPQMVAPMAAPVAQTMKAGAPTTNGNGYHTPAPLSAYGVAGAPKAVGGFDPDVVTFRRPAAVHPTQAVEEFSTTIRLADGTWYEWDGSGTPPAVPASVRSVLIRWLEEGQ